MLFTMACMQATEQDSPGESEQDGYGEPGRKNAGRLWCRDCCAEGGSALTACIQNSAPSASMVASSATVWDEMSESCMCCVHYQAHSLYQCCRRLLASELLHAVVGTSLHTLHQAALQPVFSA